VSAPGLRDFFHLFLSSTQVIFSHNFLLRRR
jgi:hypothetical protein